MSASQAGDLVGEVSKIKWCLKKKRQRARRESVVQVIHERLMYLSTVLVSVANEAGSTRFQDYRNIVNYIPASFWECDDFNHKVLVLARDLGLKVATEETNGVFALLGWVHAKGSLAEAKRVSPVLLYNSVRDCKKSFVKLQQFDGVFVRALPRNPRNFKSN